MFIINPDLAIDAVMDKSLTPTYRYLIEALEALMNLVNRNSPYCLRIAYRLHQLMTHDANYPRICDSNIKDRFDVLKNDLPKAAQALYWNPWVTIKNAKYNEDYFYELNGEASEKLVCATNIVRIYSYRPPGFSVDDSQYRWNVSTSDCGKTFKFTNCYHKNFLYRSANPYNDTCQKVSCRDSDAANRVDTNWKIYPQSDGESFIIRTSEQDEDLFVDMETNICKSIMNHPQSFSFGFNSSPLIREVYAWKGNASKWNNTEENKKRLWIIK